MIAGAQTVDRIGEFYTLWLRFLSERGRGGAGFSIGFGLVKGGRGLGWRGLGGVEWSERLGELFPIISLSTLLYSIDRR